MRRTLPALTLLAATALPAGAGGPDEVLGVNLGRSGVIATPPATGGYAVNATCGYTATAVPGGDDVVVTVTGGAHASAAGPAARPVTTSIECQAYNAYGSAHFRSESPGPTATGHATATFRAADFTICLYATAFFSDGVPIDSGAHCMAPSLTSH